MRPKWAKGHPPLFVSSGDNSPILDANREVGMSHIAQERARGDSCSAGKVPVSFSWLLIYLVGIGTGMSAAGYSVIDIIKTML